jgi:hypothetical protein
MFDPILEKLTEIAQDAWLFLAGLLVMVALLGGLYFALQGAAGAAFGGARSTSIAILGGIGIVLLVLFAFLVIPQLGELLKGLQPAPPF